MGKLAFRDLRFQRLGAMRGDSAARWADSPATYGFQWEYVTSNGQPVTSAINGNADEPVVALVRIF